MVCSNSYLYQSRHKIYYFRVILPSHAKEGTRQYEYRRSLKTRDLKVARSRGRLLRVYVDLYQEGVRNGLMEWREFKQLLDQHLEKLLETEMQRITIHGPHTIAIKQQMSEARIKGDEEAIEIVSMERAGFRSIENQIPENPIPDYVYTVTDNFLSAHNIPIDYNSKNYLKYSESILTMQVELWQQLIQLNDEARSFGSPSIPQCAELKPSHQAYKDSPLLSEAIEKFISERYQEGSWRDKTKSEYEASLRLLIKVVADRPIPLVGKEEARYYKEVLMVLPANMNKKPLYRGKTIDQIRKMTIPKEHKLSISKVNAYLTQASSLFNWAVNNLDIERNPFHGLKLQDKVAGKDKRLPFTDDDLIAIFSSKEFQTNKRKHSYYYWLPLLGLYTGARIEELCQLYLEDIYEVDGVWVFDLNENHDKKLKNEPSHRVFPVHTQLIVYGFLDYISSLKKKKVKRLFPELNKRRDGYSQSAVNWFSRFWQRLPVDHSRKSFHSFRHTALDRLKQKGIPKEQLVAVSGHKDESMATGWYGKSYEPQVLIPVIEALDFKINVPPYVDFSA